jgi:SAM-dependent methyltransferase
MAKLIDPPNFRGEAFLDSSADILSADISYDQSHYPALFQAEDRHFWFQARNQIIATVAKQLDTTYQPGYRFMEIGCGNGNVLRELEHVCKHGSVIGMDLFAEGLHFARQRVSVPLIQADVYDLPFKTKFELLGLFDVLEHLQDDMLILSHLHRMLADDGAVLITVPAHMSLWSYADKLANHKRRYTRETLSEKLRANGFRVSYITYFMMSILPMVWFRRKIANYMIAHADDPRGREHELFLSELKIRPVMNYALAFLLKQEAILIRSRSQIPVGTSLLAIAHKV